MDCMDYMKNVPDKYFNLSIVDPPYGIGESKKQRGKNPTPCATWKKRGKNWIDYEAKDWDLEIPDKFYFDELFRVSKNQIIWGGNYFYLPPTSCVIVWDKLNGETDFADGEIAWTSFDTALRIFKFLWSGYKKGEQTTRIHPTQKPIKLYAWLLKNYAKPGDKILDTHLGSGSSAIAAHKLGFDFTGIEIDKDYFDAAMKRFKKETAMPLFDNV